MEPSSLLPLLTGLEPGHAIPLTQEQGRQICDILSDSTQAPARDPLQLEAIQASDSGMTGLIHLFRDASSRLLMEYDLKRRPYVRRLHESEDFVLFHRLRQEHYDRLWDG